MPLPSPLNKDGKEGCNEGLCSHDYNHLHIFPQTLVLRLELNVTGNLSQTLTLAHAAWYNSNLY